MSFQYLKSKIYFERNIRKFFYEQQNIVVTAFIKRKEEYLQN